MSERERDPMNPSALPHRSQSSLSYDLGRAAGLGPERPTVADLQRAQAHALRRGDRRRAAVYRLLIEHRVEAAHRAARH
jgi:hypothetical protein